MSDDTRLEERIRVELDRMRAEASTAPEAPTALIPRARRATAVTLAGALIAASALVVGSLAMWRAVSPSGSSVGPATGASPSEPIPTPSPTGATAVVQKLAARPLTIAPLAPGAACPITPMATIEPGTGTGFSAGTGQAQGDGPVYVWNAQRVHLFANDLTSDGYGLKEVWVIDGSYQGPVLIRGGRIDGDDAMRFRFNPETAIDDALVLDDAAPSLQRDPSTGWRSVPSEVVVPSAGCYAFQIDGIGFTEQVVFEAVS